MNAARLLPSRRVESTAPRAAAAWLMVPIVAVALAVFIAASIGLCWLIRAATVQLIPPLTGTPLATFIGIIGAAALLMHAWWPNPKRPYPRSPARRTTWARIGETVGALVILGNGIAAAIP